MTEIQNSKYVWVIEYWNLRFICNLVLGIWDLSFGLPPFGRVPGFGMRIGVTKTGNARPQCVPLLLLWAWCLGSRPDTGF
jgi:hypothetical protein